MTCYSQPYWDVCPLVGHGGPQVKSYIEQLGMEVPFFEVGRKEIRLLPGDLLAVLTGRPSLEFPYRIAQLRAGGDSSQAHDGANLAKFS
jgi:hypothetical protein